MTKDEALKLALEALEQSQTKAPFGTDRVVYWQGVEIHEAAIAAVKEALAQPAQPEPTATYTCGVCGVSMQMEQPEQEPVAWLTGCPECGVDSGCDCDSGTYNPQQRPWVGLTDEEVREICVNEWGINEWGGYEQCRAIEAKLKDKNNERE